MWESRALFWGVNNFSGEFLKKNIESKMHLIVLLISGVGNIRMDPLLWDPKNCYIHWLRETEISDSNRNKTIFAVVEILTIALCYRFWWN